MCWHTCSTKKVSILSWDREQKKMKNKHLLLDILSNIMFAITLKVHTVKYKLCLTHLLSEVKYLQIHLFLLISCYTIFSSFCHLLLITKQSSIQIEVINNHHRLSAYRCSQKEKNEADIFTFKESGTYQNPEHCQNYLIPLTF